MSEFFVGLSLMKIMLLENVRIFTGSRRKSQLAKADFQIALIFQIFAVHHAFTAQKYKLMMQ